jgi:filamentous hemagglutinin
MAFTISCALGLMAPSALATPEGGTFVTNPGHGQILQNGPAGQTVTNVFLPGTVVDPSNRHIINWTSLDLGSQETLNFNGQNDYAVLNRITALGTPTSINGAINAMTGNVYIVNSAGIVFGQNAVINASSLHAAAANWSEGDAMHTDFLAGAPLTYDTTGDIEFHGTLQVSGGVALIGQHIRNTGTINGQYVMMAVGDRVVVEDLGSRFSVIIDGQVMDDLAATPVPGTVIADLTTGDPGVHNSGTITAGNSGNVSLLVGDLLGLAILNDGEIFSEGGEVDLLAAGGAIWTHTDNVEVANAGLIDVSDDTQAGTINMSAAAIVLEASTQANGHAGSISVQAASNVVLADGGVLVADGGMASADGGDIVVRATDGTVWAETGTGLSAKGGLFGGDGGRIELDGQRIAMQASTKLGAVVGNAGQLIITSEGAVTIESSGDALVAVDESDLSTSILAADETGRLGAGTGETLSSVDGHLAVTTGEPLRIEASLQNLRETASFTSEEIQIAISDVDRAIHATTLTFDGPIVLEQSVSLSGDDRLTLQGGGISGSESTALSLSTAGLFEFEGDIGSESSQLGNIDIATGHSVSLLGGHGQTGQNIHTSGDLNMSGIAEGPGGESTVIVAEGVIVRANGDITLGREGIAHSIESADDIDIEAGGTMTNMAEFDIDGAMRLAGGDLTNNADISAEQGITMQALTGDLETTGALNTPMDINLASANMLISDMSLTSEQGSVRLESYASDVVSLAALSAAETVSLTANAGSVSSTGNVDATDVTMTAGDGITIAGSITETSTMTATAATGDITTSGGGLLQGETLRFEATAGSIDAMSSLAGQTIEVTAASDLTITGDVTGQPAAGSGIGGNVTLVAQSGDLEVTGDIGGSDLTMMASGGGVEYTGTVVTTGDVDINASGGDLNLSGSLTGGSVDATSGGNMDLAANITSTGGTTLEASSDLTYAGEATAGDALSLSGETITVSSGSLTGGSVEAISGGNMDLAADITSSGGTTLEASNDLTYAGEADAGGALSLSGETITVSSGSLTGGEVLVDAAANASITANITSDTTVELNAADDLAYAGGINASDDTNTSDVTLTAGGDITTSGGGLLQGETLRFEATAGSIDATSDLTGQTIVVTSANDITIAGNITSVDDLTLAAPNNLTYAGVASTDGVLSLNGETITVSSGHLGGTAVTATATDTITMAADITSDTTVDLTADTVVLAGTEVQSTGGNLLVNADQITSSGTTTLRSGSDMVLAAPSGATQMRIDGSTTTLSAGGDLDLLAAVDGQGGVLSVSAGNSVLLGGDIGSSDAVQSIEFNTDELVLGASSGGEDWLVSTLRAEGDIGLNTANLSDLSGYPTVYGFGPSLTIESDAGDVRIGANQGLSYVGDLTLRANGADSNITVGDITVAGDLTLAAHRINVYRRHPGMLEGPDGWVESPRTSVVAGGTLHMDGAVSYAQGVGNDPLFAGVAGTIGVPPFERVFIDPFFVEDITVPAAQSLGGGEPGSEIVPRDWSRLFLKPLLPTPLPGQDNDSVAAETHLGEGVVEVVAGNEDILTTAAVADLADLGIELIDVPEPAVSIDRVAAAGHITDDIGHRANNMVDPTSGLIRVTRSRLKGRFVQAAVADYAAATEAGSLQAAGRSIEAARAEWEAEPGEKPDYRQWLAEGGSPDRQRAARILADLDAVFRDLRLAGLTRDEVEASRRFVNTKLSGGSI